MMKYLVWNFVFLFLASTAWASAAKDDVMKTGWFTGNPQAAFEDAKKSNKPILLYWGAKWCPPCNELRANVFAKAEFKNLLSSVIAVYLDGDSEDAQIWGDKLKASGYPTLLFFSAKGEEILRFSTSVTMVEFQEAFQTALMSTESLSAVRQQLLKQEDSQTKEQDQRWRFLAYASSEELVEGEQLLEKLAGDIQLKSKFPKHLPKEKAMFTGKLINAIANLKDDNEKEKNFKQKQADWIAEDLNSIFGSPEGVDGARSLILYSAEEVMGLITDEKQTEELKKLWLAAADRIETNQQYSTDTRLWAVSPYIYFHNQAAADAKQKKLPKIIISKVKHAVQEADKAANSPSERQAVISGAAFLLREAGLVDDARNLLIKETKTSDSPYYYYSSLASLEEKAGRVDEAKKWSSKARQTADGRATKLQWTSGDLLLKIKLKAAEAEIIPVLEEYYTLALQFDDGFSGRNAARAKRIAFMVSERLPQSKNMKAVFEKYEKACLNLKGQSCREHFSMVREKAKLAG